MVISYIQGFNKTKHTKTTVTHTKTNGIRERFTSRYSSLSTRTLSGARFIDKSKSGLLIRTSGSRTITMAATSEASYAAVERRCKNNF